MSVSTLDAVDALRGSVFRAEDDDSVPTTSEVEAAQAKLVAMLAQAQPDSDAHQALVDLAENFAMLRDSLAVEGKEYVQDPEHADKAMLALVPPDAVQEHLADAAATTSGAHEPTDIHMTLVFLGAAADQDKDKLLDAAHAVAAQYQPLAAKLSGIAHFTPEDGDGPIPHVALVDGPKLAEFREALMDELEQRGVESPSEHGFTPHMTMAYNDDASESPDTPEPLKFNFGHILVVLGGDLTQVPLTGDIKDWTAWDEQRTSAGPRGTKEINSAVQAFEKAGGTTTITRMTSAKAEDMLNAFNQGLPDDHTAKEVTASAATGAGEHSGLITVAMAQSADGHVVGFAIPEINEVRGIIVRELASSRTMRGAGTALMRAVAQEAIRLGLPAVRLRAESDAKVFYLRIGGKALQHSQLQRAMGAVPEVGMADYEWRGVALKTLAGKK